MRAKKQVFNLFFEKMGMKGNDFEKIRALLKNETDDKFFLGVREDYLSIYYMGMSVATVKVLKNGGCSYSLSYKYLKGVKDGNGQHNYDAKTEGYYSLPSDVFWDEDNFKTILLNVRNHVLGFDQSGYLYLEKACQQWIINSNNCSADSDWYYVDMEYIYKKDEEKSEHPFGRADLIAVSKKPDSNGKHKIAFVELKVGTGAYGISIQVPEQIKGKEERSAYREKVVNLLQNKEGFWSEEIKKVKLGSGIASHFVDFIHYFSEETARKQLCEEIIGILDVHKKFGLIHSDIPLSSLNRVDDINPIADAFIVTYSGVPEINKRDLSEKAQNKYTVPTLTSMKSDLAKYLFDVDSASSLPITNLIVKSEIDGLISIKEKYLEFVKNMEQQIECIQKINGIEDYRFVFRFIDIQNKDIDKAKCI